MSKIVTFGGQKGGVGKTTLTCLCANALAAPPFNMRVFVADADRQQSISRRRLVDLQQAVDLIPPYPVAFMTLPELVRDLPDLDKKHDFIFLDVPGQLDISKAATDQEAAALLAFTDLLFIPFVPGNYALEATLEYLKTALRLKASRANTPRPLEVVGMVNLFEVRTLDDRYLLEELEELKALVNVRFMFTHLNRYALFRNTDTLTSFYEPDSNDKARGNFTAWLDEFLSILKSASKPAKHEQK